jgi:NDP-sugar pyrophosphorylase family protein
MSKVNILLPIAGRAQRFVDDGYNTPKPLIYVDGKHMIERALESVNTESAHYIFIVREEHIDQYEIDKKLSDIFGKDIDVVVVDKVTQGAACSCLLAEELIDNEDPLVIFTPDCFFEPKFDPHSVPEKYDGMVGVFKSSSDAHSYVATDEEGYVTKAAEKEVISEDAVGGLYYYRKGSDFVKYSKMMIERELKIKNEYYICPVYNLLIEDGKKVGIDCQDRHVVLGTPRDLRRYIMEVSNDSQS